MRALAVLAIALTLVTSSACTRDVVRVVEVPKIVVVEEEIVVEKPTIVVVEKEVLVEKPTIVVEEKEVLFDKEVLVRKEVLIEKVVLVEKVVVVDKPNYVVVSDEVLKGEGSEESCGLHSGKDTAAHSVTHISWRASSAVTKLSPFTAVSDYVGLVGTHIFSSLVQPNPHEQMYAPDLAARWEIAPDGSSATFYLQENACFHDGEPVTADDVAFSFTAYMDPRTKSRWVQSLSMVKGVEAFAEGAADSVEGIAVVDHYTVRFDMAFPTGQFLAQAADVYILPEHILGEIAPEEIDDSDFFTGLGSQRPIGSGPWLFVKHRPDQFHELEAHEHYHFGRPKIDRVFVHLIESSDAAFIAMLRGEIDGSRRGDFIPEFYESFLADPRFVLAATSRRNNGSSYSFNFRTDWIRDSRIHQAFMWALDRKTLLETFHGGLGQFHNTNLFVPTGVETPEMMARYTPEGDTAKARHLLEEAGWDFERETVAKTPLPYTWQLLDQPPAEQQMLADAGLKVMYETMETSAWETLYYESRNYDLVRGDGWGGAVTNLHHYLHSAITNVMGYASPELDALLDAVPRALTYEELVELGIAINEMFIEDLPIVVVSSPLRLHTYGAHVWVPGFGRRPQPNELKDIMFTPEFHGEEDS